MSLNLGTVSRLWEFLSKKKKYQIVTKLFLELLKTLY